MYSCYSCTLVILVLFSLSVVFISYSCYSCTLVILVLFSLSVVFSTSLLENFFSTNSSKKFSSCDLLSPSNHSVSTPCPFGCLTQWQGSNIFSHFHQFFKHFLTLWLLSPSNHSAILVPLVRLGCLTQWQSSILFQKKHATSCNYPNAPLIDA